MIIKKRIKLGNTNYFISCDCEYKLKNGITKLCLKSANDYYDCGDLSKLIESIENNYDKAISKKYDNENWFLSDCLYIYDNIPFIVGVGDIYLSKDNMVNSMAYITKEELNKYIKDNNIKMKDNTNFELYDERTWNINQ